MARANTVLADKIGTALRKQLDGLAETYSRQTAQGTLPEMDKERIRELLQKAWHDEGALRPSEVKLEVAFKDLTWETLQDTTLAAAPGCFPISEPCSASSASGQANPMDSLLGRT